VTKIQHTPQINFKIDYTKVPKEYLEVARGMETQYFQYMIEQMNKTVDKAEHESSSQNFYNSLLDLERAQIMAKEDRNGGLKDLILQQILPPHLLNRAKIVPNKDANLAYQNNASMIKE
jgi:Rod binding domain-containing protein